MRHKNKKKKFPASQYFIMKSYWYRWYLGRNDISLCIQGQINLFPLNVCRDDHAHSLHLLLSNGSTYPVHKEPHAILQMCSSFPFSSFGHIQFHNPEMSWSALSFAWHTFVLQVSVPVLPPLSSVLIYLCWIWPRVSLLPQHCANSLYDFQDIVFNNLFTF